MDSLYTSSVIAIRPKTGEIVCHYQYTPNDVYDVDGNDEQVLADLNVNGQRRKVMIQANKNGFLYVLDRTNCTLIAAHPFVKVNWASRIDMTTGRPVLTDVYKRFLAGEEVEIWPSRGTNAVPIAFNPNTGLVYASTWNLPRIQKLGPPPPSTLGASTTGVTSRLPEVGPGHGLRPSHGDRSAHRREEVGGPTHRLSQLLGMLATGGGLVFTGKLTGEFIALDQETGRTVWQFKTGSSINSTAITYTYKGRQYVSIASGLGGGLANRYASDKIPTGGSMWTFALMAD
jgi:alcohol dehydrogenase (cytochrome c)